MKIPINKQPNICSKWNITFKLSCSFPSKSSVMKIDVWMNCHKIVRFNEGLFCTGGSQDSSYSQEWNL